MAEYDRIQKKQESRAVGDVQRKSQRDGVQLDQRQHSNDCHCCGCIVQRMKEQISIQRMCDKGHIEHPSGPCPDPVLTTSSGHIKEEIDAFQVDHPGVIPRIAKTKHGEVRSRSYRRVIEAAQQAYADGELTFERESENDAIYSKLRKDPSKGKRYFAVHKGGGGGEREIFEITSSEESKFKDRPHSDTFSDTDDEDGGASIPT